MSSVQEIEAVIPNLSRAEIEEVRAFIDDLLEPARREPAQQPFAVTPELEAWLLEAADKPTTPLTKSDFAAIRERVRAKTSAA